MSAPRDADIRLPSAAGVRSGERAATIRCVKIAVRAEVLVNPLHPNPVAVERLEPVVVATLKSWAREDGWDLTYREYEGTQMDYSDGESYTVTHRVVTIKHLVYFSSSAHAQQRDTP